ncbi:MAG TPA: peptidase M14 family protein [Firmicutes bacterium]|nr:peptidase M14 family protein [Candidatus Fermentithermobacillaceae bacterium]
MANTENHIGKVTSPEEFFGFKLGSDRKIARWDKITDYFYTIESESDRIRVVEMGKSTEGNPFLLTIISAPENLARLEHYKEINARISDPRGLPAGGVRQLVKEGKAVVCQTMSLHASEIGGTQMAPELAYDLLSSDSEATREILDNVIFLMVPCFNPDGQIMVTDWYNKHIGTEFEGTMLPYLYHKYAGHDNNRDAFALNLVESRYVAWILFTEWHPHAYQDHHHMGSTGARLYLAPYCDAIRPYADPLVWREDSWYGAHMAYALEQAGKAGILNGAQFPGWGHFGFHWIATHHNIAGMLTESASARLATPIYIHPHQLRGASPRTMPEYEPQTNFPNPWPGGWWRLRDIVEQQKIAAWSLLEICAKFRETILLNAYLKASRQTERGAAGSPKAYVIPRGQHDPLTALKLVDLLLAQGIEVKRATEGFVADGRVYPKGSFVISLAQPKMGVIRSLLGRTFFPDSYWTRNPDGSLIMYDTATDTIGEFMGVNVEPVDFKNGAGLDKCLETVVEVERHVCEPEKAPDCIYYQVQGYVLDPRLNDTFAVINSLLAENAGDVPVWRFETTLCGDEYPNYPDMPAGAFYVEHTADTASKMTTLCEQKAVPFYPVNYAINAPKHRVKHLRVGMYQRYWGGNMDEGWSRLVLENFGFPYHTLKDVDFREGNLKAKVDVIILPSDRPELILGPEGEQSKLGRYHVPPVPLEYRSGIGKEGAEAIREFVEAGGRLVAVDAACRFAIETCKLKLANAVEGLSFEDYYCRGSTIRVKADTAHPVAYGMPDEFYALVWNGQAFEVKDRFAAHDYRVIAEYPDKGLLQSGWLTGEKLIAKKPCVMLAKCGEGEVVLFGFRPLFRAQTHGTFKLLFNCLLG